MGVLGKPQHRRIFSLFFDRQELSYAEISKQTGIASNLLDYHIKRLLADGVLEKRDDAYRVAASAEYLIPHFKHIAGEERLKLPVVLFAIERKGKVLLLQRANRPYEGYWSLPGGKIQAHETIAEAAKRIALRETGMEIEVIDLCTVIDERVLDASRAEGSAAQPRPPGSVCDHTVKNGWFIFLVTAKASGILPRLPPNCDWFDPADLGGRIIPSDKWMIQRGLSKRASVNHFLVEERDGLILDFREI